MTGPEGEHRTTVWFTGLSGAGKTTVASSLKAMLDERAVRSFLLDGDMLRTGLNRDLGFSEEDRLENVRRVGEVAMLVADIGHVVLVTVISPFEAGRQAVRDRHREAGLGFVEVFVATPLEVCEERDPKGLYERARRGEVPRFTGISSPYEEPRDPDVVLKTVGRSPEECAREVLTVLDESGLLGKPAPRGH